MIIKTQDCETLVLNPNLIYMDQIRPSVYSIYAKINGGEDKKDEKNCQN